MAFGVRLAKLALNMPVAVIACGAVTLPYDVVGPHSKDTSTDEAVPRLVRLPLSAPEVAPIPEAEMVVTVGGRVSANSVFLVATLERPDQFGTSSAVLMAK